MWAIAAKVGTFFFGEDIFKIVFGVVGGLIVFSVLEANGVSQTVAATPWGDWWLAGQTGAKSSAAVQPTVIASVPGVSPPVVPTPVAGAPALLFDGQYLLQQALSWLNVKYDWGGCSRVTGVDCSCFVQSVFATVGIHMPRVTVDQIKWAYPVPSGQQRPFDLVFFDNTCTNCGANPTHVGLYLGDGKMIDAGDPVHIENVYGGHNARYGRPH